ncbi:MAG: response regulator transcription factor [Ferruginibacter sp.]
MAVNTQIKIAIADDHKIFRDGIRMTLQEKPDLEILWEANDGKEMMDKIRLKKPDVLLMDIRMPEIDGINAIGLIRKEFDDIKIIVLSMHDDEEMISKMMEIGANAYLTKITDIKEIYEAVIKCMSEGFYYSDMVNKIVTGNLIKKKNELRNYRSIMPVSFNENEIKIMQLLAEDMNTDEISKLVFLSPRTIENIRQNMKTKVNAKTIAGLLSYGIRHNLIR